MKRNLPLYILLVFLIIVNVFFLNNYLGSNNKEQQVIEHKPPGDFLMKELGFDDMQKEAFRALTHKHRQKMRGISDEIRVLKDELFGSISDTLSGSKKVESIASLIGDMETLKDLEVFRHFKEVQKLCDAEQKKKFSKIIQDALKPGFRNHRPPPHGGRPPRHGNGPPTPPDH
ncbi:Spy/CpxP family protein refolding chaperone [Hyunsoonleella ulvae]|uniref:Spy/CpxP family protein refolding chaperone n=1 Tax=Hyunsoonleella ulvae TaxID=2799948 RepID=UPI00193A18F7|nr:hypothetical protein [Hyunsoonleella ulvae]